MDLSVLERQTAVLQHLLQQHSQSWQSQENVHFDGHALVDHHQVLSHRWRPDRRPRILPIPGSADASLEKDHPMGPYSAVSSCNNSSVTGVVPISKPYQQCNSSSTNRASNSSSSLKKRKAEFDVEEEDKGKRHEAEEVGEEKSEVTTKTRREISTNTCAKVSEVQKPDYIHVRARRGQATDSHSLAERARREKISKKMKCLQDLVPGCNKVTGKAGMLDEIINYIQSLQKQVELLSMKLAAINPRLDLSIEFPTYLASLPAAAQLEATNSICFPYNPVQQGPSNFGTDIAMDQSQLLPQKSGSSSVTIPDVLLDPSCISQFQQMSGWESDWPSQFNAGFH